MSENRNVFEAITENGTDRGFRPRSTNDFEPTNAPAGSPEKIAVLRRRVEHGWPLWHELDRTDYCDTGPEWR